MRVKLLLLTIFIGGLVILGSGCKRTTTAAAETSGFAPGAFPPTLSNTDYHDRAWTRTDCLTCHETGVQNAPVTVHKTLTPEAKQVKCRSCHVLIPGSEPSLVAK